MGTDFSPKMSVESLTPQQIVRMHQLFRQAKFDDPSGDCSCIWGTSIYSRSWRVAAGVSIGGKMSNNWNSYKINQTQDRIGAAVKASIQQCCSQLKSKIVKKIQAREQQERKRNLNKYIPNVTGAVHDLLKEMSLLHAAKKKRYADKVAELLKQVSSKTITRETPSEKLAQHVQQWNLA
ncbi:DNA topoisomerase 6 subunit B [Orobanche minor]